MGGRVATHTLGTACLRTRDFEKLQPFGLRFRGRILASVRNCKTPEVRFHTRLIGGATELELTPG
jgi:hypothetical protein